MSDPGATRCTLHPGRAMADHCPHCGRPRCADDAERYAEAGCGVCGGRADAVRPPAGLELVVRAGLGALPLAWLGGWIATEYFESHLWSWIVPAVIGLAAAAAARAASGALPNRVIVGLGAASGVLGTGLGFRLVPHGHQNLFHPWSIVGLPYLCAVAGALLWPALLGPPKRSASRDPVSWEA